METSHECQILSINLVQIGGAKFSELTRLKYLIFSGVVILINQWGSVILILKSG